MMIGVIGAKKALIKAMIPRKFTKSPMIMLRSEMISLTRINHLHITRKIISKKEAGDEITIFNPEETEMIEATMPDTKDSTSSQTEVEVGAVGAKTTTNEFIN